MSAVYGRLGRVDEALGVGEQAERLAREGKKENDQHETGKVESAFAPLKPETEP